MTEGTVVIDVTYTYEDYAEANRAHFATAAGAGRLRKGLIGWVLFFGLVLVLLLMLSRTGTPPVAPGAAPAPGAGGMPAPAPVPAPAPAPGVLLIFLPLVPWLLIFAFIWFFVFRQLRGLRRTPTSFLFAQGSGRPDPARPAGQGAGVGRALAWVFAAVSVIAGLVLMLLNAALPDDAGAARSPVAGVVMTFLPFFLITIGVFAVLRRGGVGVRQLWEGQPHLQRPKRIEIDVTGVVITDAVSRAEDRWPAITHARETANLFLLYVSNYSFHMVPKRAFASTAEADACREIVRRMVVERPGPAFPVYAPVGQPPPPGPTSST